MPGTFSYFRLVLSVYLAPAPTLPVPAPDYDPPMTPDEFRRFGHAVVDLIADYRERVAERAGHGAGSTWSGQGTPAADAAGRAASHWSAIMQDLRDVIVPGLTHWQHPQFFGYFPCNASLASVLGDYVSTGLGVLGLAWQSSPALTELEEVATGWLRQMVGLSDQWDGVIQDTASTSTLLALLSARERTTGYGARPRRAAGRERSRSSSTPRRTAHSSVDKAALLAGFGREHIRHVGHDASYAMCADALEQTILEDRARGLRPCAVVVDDGDHHHDRARSGRRGCRGGPRATACGSTSMPPWPAPR